MKISGNFFREAVNRIKPAQNQPAKEDQSEGAKTDKVSIGSLGNNRTEEIKGYSPENMRADRSYESKGEKIARLREEVNNNTYNVSSEKIAEKLIGSHINDII